MARKNVGQYGVGQVVSVNGVKGEWVISGFPTRRMAIVERLKPQSGEPSAMKVSLYDVTILQRK